MAVKFRKVSETPRDNQNLTCLVYGDPGSGKSWFGASWPTPLFIAVEDGTIGLERHGKLEHIAQVENYQDVESVVSQIENGRIDPGIKTIVLDKLTELTPMLTNYLKEANSKPRMTLELWGLAVDRVRSIVKRLVDLRPKYNVVVISDAQLIKDELSGEVFAIPDSIGRFAKTIPGYFDWFLFAEQQTTMVQGKRVAEYKLHSIKYGRYPAKDRLGVLDTVEPNEFPEIARKL